MKKRLEDGTEIDVALFAETSDMQPILVSSDDYDVDCQTDEEVEFAREHFGTEAAIFFSEKEV